MLSEILGALILYSSNTSLPNFVQRFSCVVYMIHRMPVDWKRRMRRQYATRDCTANAGRAMPCPRWRICDIYEHSVGRKTCA